MCTHFETSHFHSIVHTRLYLICIHAYHAYCIVFGIGVSPGVGNEVHFVLRVTECVSIPQSPTLRIIHDGVRSCCVFMCIHPILNCAIRLLGHHASICQNEESATFRDLARVSRITAKQRLIGASRWISAHDNPDMHHPSEARQSLACMPVLFIFLVDLLIN
ncbi:hypothetical protein CsSME_00035978 [Camellia sinensis var. sinensis]